MIEKDHLQQLDQKYLQEAEQIKKYDKLFSYLKLCWEGTLIPIRELKVMLIGASHAGKTTFRKWLENRKISSSSARTNGIDIVSLEGGGGIVLNCWGMVI